MRASRGLRTALAVVATGAAAASVLVLGTAPASAATVSDCTQWGTTELQGGEYTYQQNEWNSTDTQCAAIDTSTGAWTITNAGFNLSGGAPATYPSVYKGCHWGACTAGSGLPIQVSRLGSARSSWSTTQPGSGAYDVAYDIWFNSTPTTDGQPDGTELMIWINSRGGVQPFGSQTGTAHLAGHSWNVWTGNQSSWKIISYVLQGGATSVSDLDIKALVNDSVARGSLNPAHYLIDAEGGFEIWQGGQGLASNSFSFSASTGDSGDTTPPSVPANLAVTGTTSSSASLSWPASTDNVGVTGYDVYRNGTRVGSTPSTSYTDAGLAATTAYTYTVRARDAAGNVSASSAPVTATTSGGSGGGGCKAGYHVDNDWGNGFTATVTVTNSGSSALSGWHVGWAWSGNQHVTGSWNAGLTQSGSSVSASNLSYNGSVAPGQSTTFGFQATYSGANPAPALTCVVG
ncbi:GH12 family glycosyl hydrolase domain-containing protein [Labedaea rhizosphaerae]|uniref:Fibronectin type III domain protein n=1 Tax=Labedaea rhizosphaerae TaxID=598644 RepID=A0A4R6SF18_LABRH|nr:cellulose binding domain-containing protein [Labedaea rhizosphaerae]TDP97775.1 fibronectin type III domain protein [Labedaea rhizosphaerae]